VLLLLALRFAAGVFMGGEYTSNNTLALEMIPKAALSAGCCKAPTRSDSPRSRW
jgi:MFS family permease